MFLFFFFKQKTAYEMRISDWSSDVCSSDLVQRLQPILHRAETDDHLSAFATWVKLAHGQHGLAVGLLIEGNRHVEALRVVGGRGTIVHHDQLIRYALQEAHETGEALLLAIEHAQHVEAPHPVNGRASVWTPDTNAHTI